MAYNVVHDVEKTVMAVGKRALCTYRRVPYNKQVKEVKINKELREIKAERFFDSYLCENLKQRLGWSRSRWNKISAVWYPLKLGWKLSCSMISHVIQEWTGWSGQVGCRMISEASNYHPGRVLELWPFWSNTVLVWGRTFQIDVTKWSVRNSNRSNLNIFDSYLCEKLEQKLR